MNVSRYPVAIAGAGPAGSALALALHALGVEALLLDRPLAQPFRIGESATPDVAGLLSRLGAGHALDGQPSYHGNLSLWGSQTPRLDHFLYRGHGHGWHLDRAGFDHALRQEAMARGVAVLGESGIDAIEPARDGWRLRVRGLGEVEARVVV
ncbi:NAD(P)/FAD-dependent oxidoreductase, partial [Chromobacterium piscinae]